MSRRRDDNILELFFILPWYVDIALAALIYMAAEFILPNWKLDVPFLTEAPKALSPFAKLIALMPLMMAPLSYWRERKAQKLLATHGTLDSIRSLGWAEFERLLAQFYRAQGFSVEETGGGGADGGVDLILRKGDQTSLVQCKHWKEWRVGVKVVRELNGVLAATQADAGIIITSGIFSKDAEFFAKGTPIELVDGRKLGEMIAAVNKAATHPLHSNARPEAPVQARPVSTPPKRKDDRAYMPPEMRAELEAMESDFTDEHPICPYCKTRMILRSAKRGANAGSKFWGCSSYPKCQHTMAASAN